jgi:hypothetical protein
MILHPGATTKSNLYQPTAANVLSSKLGEPTATDHQYPGHQRPTSLLHYLRGCPKKKHCNLRVPNTEYSPSTILPSRLHPTAGQPISLCGNKIPTYYVTTLLTPTPPHDPASTSPIFSRYTLSHTESFAFPIHPYYSKPSYSTTTISTPICLASRPSPNAAYQPHTLTTIYKSLHLLLTGLKLYSTALNNPATTSGDSPSLSLARHRPTTSFGTNNTPNSPSTPRLHLDYQRLKPSTTP